MFTKLEILYHLHIGETKLTQFDSLVIFFCMIYGKTINVCRKQSAFDLVFIIFATIIITKEYGKDLEMVRQK